MRLASINYIQTTKDRHNYFSGKIKFPYGIKVIYRGGILIRSLTYFLLFIGEFFILNPSQLSSVCKSLNRMS